MEYLDKILVAEDEKAISKLILIRLKRQGLEADLAQNGEEALSFIDREAIADRSYPIVLTDLNMPRIDGIELIEQIGERFGRNEILKPEIYIFSGGHENSKKLYNLNAYGLVRQTFEKTMSPLTLAKELKKFYDSLRAQ
jgi:DNA-binding response OmpR family regulator